VKLPVPVPSVVLLSERSGVGPVLQQTPRAVTAAPPSEVIFPPLEAEFAVIALGDKVFIVGTLIFEFSGPSVLPSFLQFVKINRERVIPENIVNKKYGRIFLFIIRNFV